MSISDDVIRREFLEAGFEIKPGNDDLKPYVYEAARRVIALAEAAERERWQRIAQAAQALTTCGTDKIDQFEIPAHLMAALALALDEGPNTDISRPPCGVTGESKALASAARVALAIGARIRNPLEDDGPDEEDDWTGSNLMGASG